jgi:hypothetical protein
MFRVRVFSVNKFARGWRALVSQPFVIVYKGVAVESPLRGVLGSGRVIKVVKHDHRIQEFGKMGFKDYRGLQARDGHFVRLSR